MMWLQGEGKAYSALQSHYLVVPREGAGEDEFLPLFCADYTVADILICKSDSSFEVGRISQLPSVIIRRCTQDGACLPLVPTWHSCQMRARKALWRRRHVRSSLKPSYVVCREQVHYKQIVCIHLGHELSDRASGQFHK